MIGNENLVASLARGELDVAGLSSADRAMLEYAVALTLDPGSMERTDVDELRRHGFTDTAIHDICHVASYYNYVNRIADGLGVELEDRWSEGDSTLTRGEVTGSDPEGA